MRGLNWRAADPDGRRLGGGCGAKENDDGTIRSRRWWIHTTPARIGLGRNSRSTEISGRLWKRGSYSAPCASRRLSLRADSWQARRLELASLFAPVCPKFWLLVYFIETRFGEKMQTPTDADRHTDTDTYKHMQTHTDTCRHIVKVGLTNVARCVVSELSQ